MTRPEKDNKRHEHKCIAANCKKNGTYEVGVGKFFCSYECYCSWLGETDEKEKNHT